MVFSSTLFLLYFLPAFLVVYVLFGKFRELKNWWILLASIAFYAWGAPFFVYILLGSTIIDYFIVQRLHKAKNQKRKRLFLVFSIGMNLDYWPTLNTPTFLSIISMNFFMQLDSNKLDGRKWRCPLGFPSTPFKH